MSEQQELVTAVDRLAAAVERSNRRESDQRNEHRPPPWWEDPRPKRLTAASMLTSIAGAPEMFDPIPSQFFNVDGDHAVVACPCGKQPEVAFGGLVGCDCERFYIYTGKNVLVTNSPKQREEG